MGWMVLGGVLGTAIALLLYMVLGPWPMLASVAWGGVWALAGMWGGIMFDLRHE